jgi:DNA-nicking Smr family endonuclease
VRPFEKLKKKIESQEAPSEPAASSEKKKEDYTEEELFAIAMQDVHAIEAFQALSCHRSIKGKPGTSRKAADPAREGKKILAGIADGTRPLHLPDTQEYVEWTNPEYAHFLTEQLHDGRFSVQDFLDLHGFGVSEAEAELDIFLSEVFSKSYRCVKIIHGRGLRSVKGPRLKDAVIRRILGRYRKDVIAFVSARQCDGGLGAIYLLLKDRRS